jgi:hypothetical protein
VAAEAECSNLGSSHLSALADIAILRRQTETFPFVVWRICSIDLDAFLTDTGSGRFVQSLWKHHALPCPDVLLYPLGPDGKSLIYDEELGDLPAVLRLEHDVMILFLRLGILAHEIRHELMSTTPRAGIGSRRGIPKLQEEMQELWKTYPSTKGKSLNTLPTRARVLFNRTYALSQAFFIYSHTSMWQGQGRHVSPAVAAEIEEWSRHILKIAAKAVAENRSSCRQFLFPIFLAGFASKDTGERRQALDYIRMTEQESFGRNAQIARDTLTAVQMKQAEQGVDGEWWWNVNWMGVMRNKFLRL